MRLVGGVSHGSVVVSDWLVGVRVTGVCENLPEYAGGGGGASGKIPMGQSYKFR